ncbi:Na/Ca antiporter [Legionella quinlivanii]|uniref:Na/Ca antiporter n=1 Tax=Legionella quinlivanii TaxID=45073 RepID=A0A0W0XQ13_9GAMM|nr:calcium/sodium antiporter [Legionella quinlivanii]KTD46518.1 Na/Ca antiporter [Legionella quinlivanii]SEG10459.1 cation:H+ antiporter [Legionella quinlivanii DSM 21216]STY10206.1 Ca2 /Na antiporter [Legionella quinlivanii]
MITELILFALGFILILKGGDLFVNSSTMIAYRLKIPRFIIGGTIVSLATTAPEFVVSATASYLGDSGIALGNALGSAIANIGLIVSLTAIIAPISVELLPFKRRALWMLFTTLFVFIFAWNLEISRWGGVFLVISALVYLLLNLVKARSERRKTTATGETIILEADASMGKSILYFGLGIVLVISGSWLLVNSGTAIATALKIPSFIIGLTVVAVGTSLPELITAIKSAKKNVSDLSISNIIGANILNLGLITGTAAIIRPLTMDLFTKYYAFSWVFIMIIGIMLIFWKSGKMTKRHGLIMLLLDGVYVIGLLVFPLVLPGAMG